MDFVCEICKESFGSDDELAEHLFQVHGLASPEKIFMIPRGVKRQRCQVCGIEVDSTKEFDGLKMCARCYSTVTNTLLRKRTKGKKTTIKISLKNKLRLDSLKLIEDETYDSVIQRLIESYKKVGR